MRRDVGGDVAWCSDVIDVPHCSLSPFSPQGVGWVPIEPQSAGQVYDVPPEKWPAITPFISESTYLVYENNDMDPGLLHDVAVIMEERRERPEVLAKRLFEKYDQDKSGQLEFSEMRSMLCELMHLDEDNLGEMGHVVNSAIAEFDLDGDGKVGLSPNPIACPDHRHPPAPGEPHPPSSTRAGFQGGVA